MHVNSMNRRTLALGAVLAACTVASASASPPPAVVFEYTSGAAWATIPGTSIVGGQIFNSFSTGYQATMSGSAGAATWSGAASGNFYIGTYGSQNFLSTNIANQTLTLSFSFAGGISGVSGNFFATDSSFNFVSDQMSISVVLSDTSTYSFNRTITSSTDFWGFYSTGASISSIVMSITGTGNYASTGGFVLMKNGTAVPVPGAAAIAAAGLVGVSRRRRR